MMPRYYIMNEKTEDITTFVDITEWLLKVMEIAICKSIREARQMWIETLEDGYHAMCIGYTQRYECGLIDWV